MTLKRLRLIPNLALVVTVAAACGGAPRQSDTSARPVVATPQALLPSPSAAAAPQPTPSGPAPTVPPDLALTASAEVDRIRVDVELERNPLPAGHVSWVKITVTNGGRTNVTWAHGGCRTPASVAGTSAVGWFTGEVQAGNRGEFKNRALGWYGTQLPTAFGEFKFVPKDRLGKGPYGCADIGVEEILPPGESLRETRWWSGFTDQNRALPPSGPATLFVNAASYWRGPRPDSLAGTAIELDIEGWIEAPDGPRRLSPGEIVDAALVDELFANYVDYWGRKDGVAGVARYRAADDVWEVGLVNPYESDPPLLRGVLVDPFTGAIEGALVRIWDRDVDGTP